MIKNLVTVLKALPVDMPAPRIEPNGDDGVFLIWSNPQTFSIITASVRDYDGDRGILAWTGWLQTTEHAETSSVIGVTGIPAPLDALLTRYALELVAANVREVVAR